MSRRVKITIFLLLVFCLALAGHLVWCLVYHIYGESAALRNEQNCFLCGNVESSCTCKSIDDFNALQDQLNAQNEEATTQIEALNRELELYKEEVANLKLQIQALEAQIPTEDGLCHKACSVQCPECQHPYTVEVRSEETTVIVGTSSTCKKITCVVKTVCGECGAVLDTKT